MVALHLLCVCVCGVKPPSAPCARYISYARERWERWDTMTRRRAAVVDHRVGVVDFVNHCFFPFTFGPSRANPGTQWPAVDGATLDGGGIRRHVYARVPDTDAVAMMHSRCTRSTALKSSSRRCTHVECRAD